MSDTLQNKTMNNQSNMNIACHCCNNTGMTVFYELKNQPVHSVLLMPTREKAINYPRGDISLAFCKNCGFISNTAFDPAHLEYSEKYEETQGFSSTFNTFHKNLASYLIDKYGLRNKSIIEIGCGKGEFLTLLCELGENRGVGFDPAYISERNQSSAKDRITFICDLYSEKYANYQGDFVCCKMTLEHIQHTADFVSMIRRSLGERTDTVVFFQVPDVTRILNELAFWDIYYEHCSYFSPYSMSYLFKNNGFDVINVWKGFDEQYLLLEARPAKGDKEKECLIKNDDCIDALSENIEHFSRNCRYKMNEWRNKIRQFGQNKQRVVIWGASSKGVSFLTSLHIRDEIEFVVDINPYKQGTFVPGTGQKIVSPDFIKKYKPNVVIIMNPIYREEIKKDLRGMGLSTELITV